MALLTPEESDRLEAAAKKAETLVWARYIRMVGDPDEPDYRPETGDPVQMSLLELERADFRVRKISRGRACWVVSKFGCRSSGVTR